MLSDEASLISPSSLSFSLHVARLVGVVSRNKCPAAPRQHALARFSVYTRNSDRAGSYQTSEFDRAAAGRAGTARLCLHVNCSRAGSRWTGPDH